jgi:phosphomannomutase
MSIARDSQIKFGTDGWRGIIADDFTFPNVWRVTRAIASYIETVYSRNRPILVAFDTRFLADRFAYSAAEVLTDLGWRVRISERDCPTPVIAYHARLLESAGALMFTASHNAAQYCGIKYIPDYGGPATTEITDSIVAHLAQSSDDHPQGDSAQNILKFDPKPEYLRFIYSQLDLEKIRSAKLKVKYDALYSTSRGYLDEILSYCGCDYEVLHSRRDVLFGGGTPEPKLEQLLELQTRVREAQADLGMATDGDSDRFAILDDRGNLVSPNLILLLLARHLFKNKGKTGTIVRTVATTHLLDKLAQKYGLKVHETPVGFKYISEKMRTDQVLIGGEESGGLSVVGHIPEKDGILANMLIAEVVAFEGKPLSQLVEEITSEVDGITRNYRLDLPLENQGKIDRIISNPNLETIGELKVTKINNQDGIKFYLEDGSWVLMRPSGTEPLVRIYLETSTEEREKRLINSVKNLLG